jgi:hypothetical protein
MEVHNSGLIIISKTIVDIGKYGSMWLRWGKKIVYVGFVSWDFQRPPLINYSSSNIMVRVFVSRNRGGEMVMWTWSEGWCEI